MKRIALSVITIVCALAGFAMESNGSEMAYSAAASTDTTVMTLEQIIAQESRSQYDNDYARSMSSVWGKNTFLNLIYNAPHKMKSDEFPSTTGVFSREYKPKWGVGLEWGHTYNFHSRPLGSVLFIGLDYTWMDLNFNKYDYDALADFKDYTPGVEVHNLPWHNEKMTLSYGMSIGPSLTFYPFTSIRNSGVNKFRLQVYFHVGYCAEGALIKNVNFEGSDSKNGYAFGHGLFMGYGANLSWDFIGVGLELRNANNMKFKATDKDYDTGKMKMKEETTRLYLQFRF